VFLVAKRGQKRPEQGRRNVPDRSMTDNRQGVSADTVSEE
jgi:hypothetical protein